MIYVFIYTHRLALVFFGLDDCHLGYTMIVISILYSLLFHIYIYIYINWPYEITLPKNHRALVLVISNKYIGKFHR